MSVEALSWLANRAPGVKPHWVGTLFELCNAANAQGRGSHPSQARLAWVARKTERAVRDDLDAMQEAGLIRRGDQRMVLHLPPDRRPIVWDIAMELDRGPRPEPGRPGRPAKKRGEPQNRAEPQFPPVSEGGVSAGQNRGEPQCPPVSDENGGNHSVNRGEPQFRQTSKDLLGEDPSTSRADRGEQETTAAPPDPEPETAERIDLTAEEHRLAVEVCAAAPRWSPYSVRKVLASAEVRERVDRRLVRVAFLLAAADRRTRTPYRLLHDACPFWDAAEAEVYPREVAEAAEEARTAPGAVERGWVPVIGPGPSCGHPGCDPDTRTLLDPDSGAALPGRPRCPRCHPQSPAGRP